jgi:hypothetical protein
MSANVRTPCNLNVPLGERWIGLSDGAVVYMTISSGLGVE